jgi:hypothetical protein
MAETRLSEVLSDEELAKLEEWIQEYGTVSIDASDPQGVSDRMVITLEFMGLGNQEVVAAADEQQLLEFAQDLNQDLSR